MAEKAEIPLVLERPVPSKAFFVDFKTEREQWNKYRLSDKTFLRAKLVFSAFMMDKTIDDFQKEVKRARKGQKLKLAFGFSSTIVYGVEALPSLRGSPNPTKYSREELKESIVEEVDFETTRGTWNSYLLKNEMQIKARFSPTSISRTSKFDGVGMPVYWVESGVDVKIKLPERIEKILETKKAKRDVKIA